METEITGGSELFGGVDFNQDIVFDITPTGEVVNSKVEGKPTGDEKEEKKPLNPIEEILEAKKKASETKYVDEGNNEVKPQEESAPSSPSDPITLFASALSESGAIVAEQEEVTKAKTFDDLVGLVKSTIAKNEFADLSDTAKQALEDIRAGVPIEAVKAHHNNQLQLEAIAEDQYIEAPSDDDEQIELKQKVRKQLIVQSYMINGYSQERAERLAQRSIDIGEDAEDAKTAVQDLKAADQRRIDTERASADARKVDNERKLKDLESTVLSTEEILPGLPVSEKLRKQVFDTMTKPIESGPNGPVFQVQKTRAKDPIAFDLRLHYLYALGLFDETPDMNVFTRSQTSKAAEQFQNAVQNSGFGGGSNAPQVHGATDDDLLDSLSSMKF